MTYVNCLTGTQDVCSHSECVKNDHIAKYGIRSWLVRCLREECGITLSKTYTIDTLEAMLDFARENS